MFTQNFAAGFKTMVTPIVRFTTDPGTGTPHIKKPSLLKVFHKDGF